jgi:hypothetical protein
MGVLNQCGACRKDFTSIASFDRHRVGVHAYTYSQGLRFPELVEDGRRCLDNSELNALGIVQIANGRWQDTAAVERAQRVFS